MYFAHIRMMIFLREARERAELKFCLVRNNIIQDYANFNLQKHAFLRPAKPVEGVGIIWQT